MFTFKRRIKRGEYSENERERERERGGGEWERATTYLKNQKFIYIYMLSSENIRGYWLSSSCPRF